MSRNEGVQLQTYGQSRMRMVKLPTDEPTSLYGIKIVIRRKQVVEAEECARNIDIQDAKTHDFIYHHPLYPEYT